MERPLNKEEFEALSKELNEVLTKHNAVMSVKSTIELTRIEDDPKEDAKADQETGGVR